MTYAAVTDRRYTAPHADTNRACTVLQAIVAGDVTGHSQVLQRRRTKYLITLDGARIEEMLEGCRSAYAEHTARGTEVEDSPFIAAFGPSHRRRAARS